MKLSTSPSVLVLLLVAAFAWSGLAHGLSCACEAATGACIKCCGSETSGFKHCGLNGNDPVPPPPPAVIYAPYGADKAMPSPVEEPPSPAPAAAEAAKKQQEADYKAVDKKESKKGKVKNPGKSAIPSKTLESTGKDR